MFIKTLKYDFMFSKAWFLISAAVMLVVAIATRVYAEPRPSHSFASSADEVVLAMVIMGVAIISIFQVLIFFNRYLFDNTGRIMLTLPVKRFTLLASKLLVSVVWFNFMLLIAAITVTISDSPRIGFTFMGLSRELSFVNFMALIEVNIAAVSLMLIMFFSSTLANSRLWRRHFHGLALVVGIVIAGLLFWVTDMLFSRHMEWGPKEIDVPRFDGFGEYIGTYSFTTYDYIPVVCASIGRVPIGTGGAFFDVYGFGVLILFIILMFWVTNYFLKKRVCI